MIRLFESAKAAHGSVVVLLPKEDHETQNEWFARITKYHAGFMDDVKQWLFENERHFAKTSHVIVNLPTAADSVTPSILPEKAPVESKEEIPPQDNPPPSHTPKSSI